MRMYLKVAIAALIMLNACSAFGAASRWGANYFPNIPLTTHEGKEVRFFDDLIKDKIVAINFIYTSCPDTCPLETAQLTRVQSIMGDRLGKDVFFYSITIDPKVDTPAVMKEYREKFGAKWDFLTGKEADIIKLRRKLGLYIEEIQDGSNNHNVSMIIGNQTTGRWMKRSPFENPHVLADQIGNWLDGWKAKPKGGDYASAPELRNITPGEQLFRTRCSTCHTVTGVEAKDALGPDLLGVNQRREKIWLLNWLRAPDQMIANKDPIALALLKKYDNLAMPNMRLNQQEANDLLNYIDEETTRLKQVSSGKSTPAKKETLSTPQQYGANDDVVAVMNAWVREAIVDRPLNAGYMTLINVGNKEEILIKVESDAFKSIEVHEMSTVNGLMKMQELEELVIPPNGQARLAPGGKHLMMKEPTRKIKKGQNVDLTLSFKSGKKQTISVKIEAK